MNRPHEVEVIIYFPDSSEPPDQQELEAAIQERYPDSYIVEYDEEEV